MALASVSNSSLALGSEGETAAQTPGSAQHHLYRLRIVELPEERVGAASIAEKYTIPLKQTECCPGIATCVFSGIQRA